jgi:hypothetical protein
MQRELTNEYLIGSCYINALPLYCGAVPLRLRQPAATTKGRRPCGGRTAKHLRSECLDDRRQVEMARSAASRYGPARELQARQLDNKRFCLGPLIRDIELFDPLVNVEQVEVTPANRNNRSDVSKLSFGLTQLGPL